MKRGLKLFLLTGGEASLQRLPVSNVIPDTPAAFDVAPYTTETSTAIVTKGKKKNTGFTAKFVQDISGSVQLAAGRVYTMQYTADWSKMSNLGKNNEVGFLFKAGNSFFLIGYKGDGSGGVTKHIVEGANKWNQSSGFTEIDTGAPTQGSLSGPNYVQLRVSDDGTHISLFSGNSVGLVWTAEVSLSAITPFTNVSQITAWGPGALLSAEDYGDFSISVTIWAVTSLTRTFNDDDYAATMALVA